MRAITGEYAFRKNVFVGLQPQTYQDAHQVHKIQIAPLIC